MNDLRIGAGMYRWIQHYSAAGMNAADRFQQILEDVAHAGIRHFEPFIFSVNEAKAFRAASENTGVKGEHVYENATLHRSDIQTSEIARVVELGRWCQEFGARTLVINACPIDWGKPLDKTDSELRVQAAGFNKLGEALKQIGITLSYHLHDAEMRQAAREAHHMLLATDPALMNFCFDVHWVFRGAGNSVVAAEDFARLYGSRVDVMHLRQSIGGLWAESFGEGDIDFTSIIRIVEAQRGSVPFVALEQLVEKPAEATMPIREAYAEGAKYLRHILRRAG